MRCIICDSKDQWENVDQFRLKKIGMAVCKKCGFVSYPEYWENLKEDNPEYAGKSPVEKMKLFYSETYRNPPHANNLYSGQKKLHYHAAFLEEYLPAWNEKEDFNICDVGSAYGLFLQWFKQMVPNANIHGTEWATAYKRNAFHEFGIDLTDEIDTSKKYDVIALYKVGEHLLDADEKLLEYKSYLKEDGLLYISVPVWFECLFNFGVGNMDLNYMYSVEHINVWTRKLFKQLLRKCGLEIVKDNYTYYDDTYLCKKCDPVAVEDLEFENYEDIKKVMHRFKEASKYQLESNLPKALESWSNAPTLWVEFYERNRKEFHEKGIEHIQQHVIEPAQKACPCCSEIWALAGDIYMRYGLYNEAIQSLDTALKMRPGSPMYLNKIANCFRAMAHSDKNPISKIEHLNQARDISRHIKTISFQNFEEMTSWIYADNANIPTPAEGANNTIDSGKVDELKLVD